MKRTKNTATLFSIGGNLGPAAACGRVPLRLVVEGEPELVAEGDQGPLHGVRLGRLDGILRRLPDRPGEAAGGASRTTDRTPSLAWTATLTRAN
jgi:hypothetical protein